MKIFRQPKHKVAVKVTLLAPYTPNYQQSFFFYRSLCDVENADITWPSYEGMNEHGQVLSLIISAKSDEVIGREIQRIITKIQPGGKLLLSSQGYIMDIISVIPAQGKQSVGEMLKEILAF